MHKYDLSIFFCHLQNFPLKCRQGIVSVKWLALALVVAFVKLMNFNLPVLKRAQLKNHVPLRLFLITSNVVLTRLSDRRTACPSDGPPV